MCSSGKPSIPKATPAAVPASQVADANVDEVAKTALGSDSEDEARRRALGKRGLRVQLGTSTTSGGTGLKVG